MDRPASPGGQSYGNSQPDDMFQYDFEELPQDGAMPSEPALDPGVPLSDERGQSFNFAEIERSGMSAESILDYHCGIQSGNMTYRTETTPGTSDNDQQYDQQIVDDYQTGLGTNVSPDYILQGMNQRVEGQGC